MDKIEEITQKCIELGKAIAQMSIYKEFKQAEYQLLHNPEAQGQLEDLQKLQKEQYRKRLNGEELTKEEEEALKKMEELCLKDPLIASSNNANLRFQKFMEQISGKIKEGIKSVDKM